MEPTGVQVAVSQDVRQEEPRAPCALPTPSASPFRLSGGISLHRQGHRTSKLAS